MHLNFCYYCVWYAIVDIGGRTQKYNLYETANEMGRRF